MSKKIMNLNGKWIFKKDKLNIGERAEWYLKKLKGKNVQVPAAWQSYDRELYNYCGYAWYYKEFNLKKKNEKRYFIKFEAVDYQAELYCNGDYIGSHRGGYTPFEFELTSHLNHGENMVHLKVYDPKNNDEIPHGKQGSWYSRVSGIWQGVNLIEKEKSFIKNLEINSEYESKTVNFNLKVEKYKKLKNPKLKVKVFSPVKENEILKEKEFQFKAKLELNFDEIFTWSVANPYLYDFRLTLRDGKKIIDEIKDYFAFRKIEIKDNRFFLNEKPIYIRGALDQAFWSNSRYTLESYQEIENEIKKVKGLGFNLLRKHIKIEDPKYLEAADRLGILIWEEPPNYTRWTKEARKIFKEEYTEMVKRDKNHPSLIIWSIYNEEWGLEWDLQNDKEKQKWLIDFYDYAKELDPTRPVCDNSGWAHVKTDINDIHRYFAVPEDAEEWKKDLDEYVIESPEKNYVKAEYHNGEIKLLSEFGMWGLPEPSKIKGEYKKIPQWYNNSSKLFDEKFKVPITAEKNFNKYQLDNIFSDLDELALATQKRESEGMKYLIEEIRKRKEIGGYIVTELSDIEWETNGFLDFFRDEKPNFDYDLSYNKKIMISLGIKERNISDSDYIIIEPVIINNSNSNIEGDLYYQIDNNKKVKLKTISLKDSSRIKLDKQSIKLNKVDNPKTKALKLKLYLTNSNINKEEIIDRAELRIYPAKKLKKSENKISVNFKMNNKEFKNKLKNNSYKFQEDADLIISDYLDSKLLRKVKTGAKLLFLAEKGSEIKNKAHFNFNYQPKAENWDKAASFNFFAADEYLELPFKKITDWELESLYPEYYLSNFEDLGECKIKAGSFKAWLGDIMLSLVEFKLGRGKILVNTFKLIDNYGEKIHANYLFNNLVKRLSRGD